MHGAWSGRRLTRLGSPVIKDHIMFRARAGRLSGSPLTAAHIGFHATGFQHRSYIAAGVESSWSTRRRTAADGGGA
jgi:hypothetical protein